MEEKKVELPKTIIWMKEPGIICTSIKQGATIEYEDAVLNIQTSFEVNGNKPFKLIIDPSGAQHISRKARTYLSSKSATQKIQAVAIYAINNIGKIIGNFFIGINRPPMAIKLFESKDEATEWLRRHPV